MLFDLTRYSPADFKHETRQLLALSIPMMLGQIATVAIGVVDTAMSGAAGKDDLTAVALGSSVFSTLFITFMGIMAALNPIIAQQHGAGGTKSAKRGGKACGSGCCWAFLAWRFCSRSSSRCKTIWT